MAIRVDSKQHVSDTGFPLIPDLRGLTETVIESLDEEDRAVIEQLRADIEADGESLTIETILTKARRLTQAIGSSRIHGLDGADFGRLCDRICEHIGQRIDVMLPIGANPFAELASLDRWDPKAARRGDIHH